MIIKIRIFFIFFIILNNACVSPAPPSDLKEAVESAAYVDSETGQVILENQRHRWVFPSFVSTTEGPAKEFVLISGPFHREGGDWQKNTSLEALHLRSLGQSLRRMAVIPYAKAGRIYADLVYERKGEQRFLRFWLRDDDLIIFTGRDEARDLEVIAKTNTSVPQTVSGFQFPNLFSHFSSRPPTHTIPPLDRVEPGIGVIPVPRTLTPAGLSFIAISHRPLQSAVFEVDALKSCLETKLAEATESELLERMESMDQCVRSSPRASLTVNGTRSTQFGLLLEGQNIVAGPFPSRSQPVSVPSRKEILVYDGERVMHVDRLEEREHRSVSIPQL